MKNTRKQNSMAKKMSTFCLPSTMYNYQSIDIVRELAKELRSYKDDHLSFLPKSNTLFLSSFPQGFLRGFNNLDRLYSELRSTTTNVSKWVLIIKKMSTKCLPRHRETTENYGNQS
jgi:hypothetical protein